MKYLHYLAATVFFGSLGVLAQAQDTLPMAREVTARPSAPPENETVRHVLLSDGRILIGEVTPHKDGGYNVRQKLGPIRVESDEVEGMFPSLEAIYLYKRENLPPRDIQERMRLYRWCMTRNLLEQAKEQLQAILALSPDHEESKANLGLLEIRMARQESRTDDQLVRTSATLPMDNSPREMDPALLNRALREMAARTAPVIFDLPEAQALKRGQEFNEIIHPMILQVYCAGCHNERTPNGFPLVSAKGRALRDPAIQRANLDTTLKLVSPENLMQSPLLVNSLLPHKPNNRPIFQGPNHAAYRLLSNWVSQLQSRNTASARIDRPVERSAFGSGSFQADERSAEQANFADEPVATGFAVEGRSKSGDPNLPALPIEANPDVVRVPRGQLPGQGFERAEPAMPGRIVPGSYNGGSPNVPPGTTFPLPLPAGASPEELLKTLQAEEAARDAQEAEASKRTGAPTPVEPELPKPVNDDSAKPRKPVKIDQNLLDKFIIQRRAGG